jgi:Mce-associated membrane protein
VEDQPADSGDLTTDAELPAQPAGAELPAQPADAAAADDATGATAARRRHRMPLRRELASTSEDGDDTATDETTESDELPDPTVAEAAEAEAATPRRRWGLFRRRTKTSEPAAVSAPAAEAAEAEEPEGPKPAGRTPVGKASRAAKTVTKPEPTVDEEPVDEGAKGEGADGEGADGEEAEGEDAPQEEQILVPHRPAGKRLIIAAAAAGVVFVGAAAFAGATLQPYLSDRALVHTKLDIARTAANAITTLWTYTPDNMDKLPDRSSGYLGGDFANEYRKYIDAIVASNKQAQVTNTTQVMGTAVETVTPSEATALVYTNSVATSPVSKNIPSLRYLSYRLTMQRHDAKWFITRMSTVTSFDLTPQL